MAGGIIGSSAWWNTSVGTRIVGRTARTSDFGQQRAHEGDGPWADRQTFNRAHAARISSFHGMSGLTTCWNSPLPHMATMAA